MTTSMAVRLHRTRRHGGRGRVWRVVGAVLTASVAVGTGGGLVYADGAAPAADVASAPPPVEAPPGEAPPVDVIVEVGLPPIPPAHPNPEPIVLEQDDPPLPPFVSGDTDDDADGDSGGDVASSIAGVIAGAAWDAATA